MLRSRQAARRQTQEQRQRVTSSSGKVLAGSCSGDGSSKRNVKASRWRARAGCRPVVEIMRLTPRKPAVCSESSSDHMPRKGRESM